MNYDYPVVLGLAGKAATGKTVTANALAPVAQMNDETSQGSIFKDPMMQRYSSLELVWSHLYFAMPLYKIVNVRQKTEGADLFDRTCYELHDILVDIFKGYITYDETVDAVYEIAKMDCPKEGKPRTFMQLVGTEMIRGFDPDAWVKWMDRKVKEEFIRHETEQSRQDEMYEWHVELQDEAFLRKTLGVVISDMRFPNEVDYVRNHPNGIAIKLIVDPEVARQRLVDRDGVASTPEQEAHSSETSLDDISDDQFHAVIDTSELSVAGQVAEVKRVIGKYLA